MARVFYTEKDIEDMVRQGVQSLEITENVVLTSLAYEKARALGLRLIQDRPEELPSAPIRPYLNKITPARPAAPPAPDSPTSPRPAPASAAPNPTVEPQGLRQRITQAVIARMGDQIEASLLDSIISRVLNATGLK